MDNNFVECDRCGSLYEESQISKVDLDSDKYYHNPSEYWLQYEHWDICPKCRLELKHFMNSRRFSRDAS